MAVVACVIDDVDLRTRLARIVSMRPGTTVVESDCSPAAVRTALAGTQITAALLCPLALPRFLEMRVALNVSSGIGREPRIVIAAPNVDSAYVYRAFSFGANDVIDISRNDGHVAESSTPPCRAEGLLMRRTLLAKSTHRVMSRRCASTTPMKWTAASCR